MEPVFGIIIAWRQTKRIGGGGPMLDDGVFRSSDTRQVVAIDD